MTYTALPDCCILKIHIHLKQFYMKLTHVVVLSLFALSLFSCVSNKKFKTAQASAQARYDSVTAAYVRLQTELRNCTDQNADNASKKAALEAQVDALNKQIAYLKENN